MFPFIPSLVHLLYKSPLKESNGLYMSFLDLHGIHLDFEKSH